MCISKVVVANLLKTGKYGIIDQGRCHAKLKLRQGIARRTRCVPTAQGAGFLGGEISRQQGAI